MKQYFLLYACCIPVNGISRGIIYDLQRSSFQYIPNVLCSKLISEKHFCPEEWMKEYNHEQDDQIKEYIEFLIENEFGFITGEPENFPKLSLDWKSPSRITNMVLNLNKMSNFSLRLIDKQLNKIGCEALQINYAYIPSYKTLDKHLSIFSYSRIKSIEIKVNNSAEIDLDISESIFKKHLRLYKFTQENQHEIKVIELSRTGQLMVKRSAIEQNFKKNKFEDFSIGIPFFTESQKHHTFFNRKVFIGENGEIKNTQSNLGEIFGNIETDELEEIIKTSEFQFYWHLTKEILPVCNTCEFRHMCMDRRIPLKTKVGNWYFQEECNYDPKTMKWS